MQHNNGIKSIVASGECLRYAQVGRVAFFELNGNFDLKQVALDIKGKWIAVICDDSQLYICLLLSDFALRDVPYRINKKSDGPFVVEFKPTQVGEYSIQIAMDQMAIQGSPFRCYAFDATKVHVYHPREATSVYQEVQYESKYNIVIYFVKSYFLY